MISEKDKEIIIKYSKKYNVSSVILFGSSTQNDRESIYRYWCKRD